MYIAICDDQDSELQFLIHLLKRWQSEKRTALRLKAFNSASAMLDAAEKEPFSLYLLDVMMPGMDGLEAAHEIRRFDDTAEIVFLTSSPGFAYESYSVRALDYLLKPVDQDMLFPILDRLLLREHKPEEGFTLKCGTTWVRIPFSQLSYVEVNGKHLYFNLTDGSVRKVYGTLREYEEVLLMRPEFMQTHRSYIVNMLQAAELSPSGIHTFSGKHLPVSRLLYPQLQKDYLKMLFAQREKSSLNYLLFISVAASLFIFH